MRFWVTLPSMLETIVTIVLALGLIATVIWAADKYIAIPAPFTWAKGLIIFALIVAACYFIWTELIPHHLGHGHF